MTLAVRDVAGKATILAGEKGMGRRIGFPQPLAPRLADPATFSALAERLVHLRPAEIDFLCGLPMQERKRVAAVVTARRPACIVVTGGRVCRELLAAAETKRIPVLRSGNITRMARLLAERLDPTFSLHGVLVQIFGLGTLLIGESAVGKSEAALDLVLRGHKLAADDLVILEKRDGEVTGRPSELGADLLQIRGLGIIDIRALYGESATISETRVGLVVELEEWREGERYSLLGLREKRYRLLGINLPYLKLPVKPGRNMATLIEVAARNQMLKNRGIFAARDLSRKLRRRLTA